LMVLNFLHNTYLAIHLHRDGVIIKVAKGHGTNNGE